MSMLENSAQKEAIETIDGQLLIVACPGSGKTTTLIERIANMVRSGINGKSIIMMTFSRAAAQEMKKRFLDKYGDISSDVNFCTIHSFCFGLLRMYCGYEPQSIISNHEIYTLLKPKLRKYRAAMGNDYYGFVNKLMLDIGNIKNSQTPMAEFVPTCTKKKDLFKEMYETYEKYKADNAKIDYDDMLILTLQLLESRPDIVDRIRGFYRYIQVDEFQDTNVIQAKIIYLMAGENGNLAVVGDDDQSIYAFRAATPQIMLNFKRQYPKAKVIRMGTNYRSKDEIIRAAGKVIVNNKERFDKDFEGVRGQGGQVKVLYASSFMDEVRSIVQSITVMHQNDREYSDIAVLFRNNAQAENIAWGLAKAGIPFSSTEKVKSRYESFIYNDIMDFYNVATAEPGADINDKLYTLLCKPMRYFKRGIEKNGMDRDYMIKFARQTSEKEWQFEKKLDQIDDFFIGMHKLSKASPAEALSIITGQLRYADYLSDYADFRNEDFEDYYGIYKQFASDIKENNIKTWMDWKAYAAESIKEFESQNKKNGEGVTISTMHKSKGLEWDVVFMSGCTKQIIPGKNSKGKALEEERRLFYVAMTRAKDELYICYNGFGHESPFIKEVEEKVGGSLNDRIKMLG